MPHIATDVAAANLARPAGPDRTEGGRPEAHELTRGTVRAFISTTQATVETGGGASVYARQAASCLLAPTIGDIVLLHVSGDDAYILAVLERPAGHAAEIAVPGATATTIRSSGSLDVEAERIGLRAAHEIDIVGRALRQTGDFLFSHFRRIAETVVDRTLRARTVTTHADTRTSLIHEADVLNTATLVQTVDGVSTQTSEITMVTARRDVRLDAERVSVG